MDVRVGLWRRLSTKELMVLNCGVGEDSWESLGLARRSNQSILKISPGISLEGMMLKLKFQYFGHLMWRVDSLEKTLLLGGIGGRRRRGHGWMASLTQWTWVWVNSGSWWWTGRPGVLRFMGSQKVRQAWAIEVNWGSSSHFSKHESQAYSGLVPTMWRGLYPPGEDIHIDYIWEFPLVLFYIFYFSTEISYLFIYYISSSIFY